MAVPQVALLRFAAFLVDALSISLLLVLPASLISYGLAWLRGSTSAINVVWLTTLGVLLTGILIRDGLRGGRSPGKTLLGLVISTRSGKRCGIARSIVRNLPLIVPLWNLLEVILVLAGQRRTGDRITGVTVAEE
jgi:uncharacterized RDD family membrane protein YckC